MTTINCPACGTTFDADVPQCITVGDDPMVRERVKSGEPFLFECPACGQKTLACGQCIYNDAQLRLLVVLSQSNLNSDGLPGYTCRLVSDIGSLIEKVKIFEAGLDDVVIELCKTVTSMEMKKEMDLKFFKMDGVDGEITLTYPENGEMQMLVIGHNVYSDCAGIVGRNPSMQEKSKGLVRIDKAWINQFIAD